jgi:PhzF family phenazine biosynthesis protein
MVTFYILDVFAVKKYSGNQLAVVPDADKLSVREMKQIVKEMNNSETTFIRSDEKAWENITFAYSHLKKRCLSLAILPWELPM